MKKITIFLLLALLANTSFAQVDQKVIEAKRKAALEEMKTLPEDAFKEYYQNVHARMPKKKDIKDEVISNTLVQPKNNSKALQVPNDMIFPGEFDEVQAIIMTWPYITRTVASNQYAEQLFENKGFPYTSTTYVLEPVYSVPDVSNNQTTKLFRSLANGIQQNAEVWINIWNWDDSTAIKTHMANNNMPLTNYRFFQSPGNSFWYRDCGPVAFYYGEDDEIGFMDFEYYGGRPLDDLLPVRIAEQAGYSVFTNTIEYEGGNILVDGLGSLYTTDAVYDLNKDTYGLYYETNNSRGWSYHSKMPLSNAQVQDSLTHLMNLHRCIVLPALKYDGGTGHIDLYTDLVDEATFVSTKHPEQMANLSDPILVEKNMDSLISLFSSTPFGLTYYNTRIPLPAKDNGSWYTSQAEYNNYYTRSYSNHTFVNNAIMQPVFYSGTNGDVAGNQEAIVKMKEAYPGYEFVEIDVRDFDGYGGAIHCITKQIPAENPVRIYHYPVRWLNTTDNQSNSVWISALAQNKSGIAEVKLYHRRKGDIEWNEVVMNVYDGNIYDSSLPINPNLDADTIEYYISATSNNGKTISKPITAPNGFYTFIYGKQVNSNSDYIGIDCMEDIKTLELGEFYPNPAKDYTKIDLSNEAKGDISVKVINFKGQVLANSNIKKGEKQFEINTSNLNSGAYWVVFGSNTNTIIKKIIVTK